MLTYLLAITVGLGSFGLYMAAFFFPEVHRRYDLIWSGVGLFYALVLWVCAGRITGGVLLGQMASVALLGWFGWQTLTLRRSQTPVAQQTQLPASATSTSEVIQVTVHQLRSNFQKSADRSPLAAQLNQAIDRLESGWIGLTSWVKALTTSLSTSELSASELSAPEPSTVKSTPSSSGTSVSEASSDSDISKTDPFNSKETFLVSNPHEIKQSNSSEPYAEWSDLEAESYPDFDTIDSAADFHSPDPSSSSSPSIAVPDPNQPNANPPHSPEA